MLRAALPNVGRTGFNVLRHSMDVALGHQIIKSYHNANNRLCGICQTCPIYQICGGGYLSHRFSAKSLFNNPSIYCLDLTLLIAKIRNATLGTLPANALAQSNLKEWSYEDILLARRA